jgi:RNA polymerase sigma factor (TIGR02999 family)
MVRPEGTLDDPAAEPITSWVIAARGGDRDAAERLYRAVYDQLRRIASAQRMRLSAGSTLSTTVVVHEVYLRLEQAERLTVADRHHFFSLAARIMRQILIDDARRRIADRRGAGAHVEPLADIDVAAPQRPEQWLALDEALDGLAAQDEGLAKLVELRFFAGLPFEDIAGLVESSERTVRRQWRRARAYLYDRMTTST